ncbi:MAG: hypothetical protein NVV59_20175 [Chitinophagaceae bacterium]|nr:hypothetical protein [Chitinophagaceae bacterium]
MIRVIISAPFTLSLKSPTTNSLNNDGNQYDNNKLNHVNRYKLSV